MRCPLCKIPNRQFIVGSGIKSRQNSSKVSVLVFISSFQTYQDWQWILCTIHIGTWMDLLVMFVIFILHGMKTLWKPSIFVWRNTRGRREHLQEISYPRSHVVLWPGRQWRTARNTSRSSDKYCRISILKSYLWHQCFFPPKCGCILLGVLCLNWNQVRWVQVRWFISHYTSFSDYPLKTTFHTTLFNSFSITLSFTLK